VSDIAAFTKLSAFLREGRVVYNGVIEKVYVFKESNSQSSLEKSPFTDNESLYYQTTNSPLSEAKRTEIPIELGEES